MASVILASGATLAAPPAPPSCDPVVAPEVLAEHSGHPWREGAPIQLRGDVAACNYYQQDAPAGLSLAVRNDPQKRDFEDARETHAPDVHEARGLAGEAFYYRHRAAAPFADSWGLVLHAHGRTIRLEGVPEAGNAERAKAIARDIVERALERFSKS